MGRKGKTQKHTTKEIQGKVKAAKEKRGAAGGGGAGAAKRNEAKAKASVPCDICKVIQPSLKTMQIHYDSKHSKLAFPAATYEGKFGSKKQAAKDTKSKWK
eukprot:maker-scaffold_4-snap-gene-10.58-mRNA-1 protein AED:0.23 eAED:0.23 QI:128/1/1/1/1/1/2/898/100